jgi:hypothetical protein
MTPVRFLSCAEDEFAQAVRYYNEQSPGLGFEFAAEVRRASGRIQANPRAWHALSSRTRRCRVSRFPYGVVYQEREDCLLVVAVMHMSRHPEGWRKRV